MAKVILNESKGGGITTTGASVTASVDMTDIAKGSVVVEQNVMIPMRDGTKLACDVYRINDGVKRPVLLEKSPYDNKQFVGIHEMICSPYVMAQKGFVAVVVEDRGREASEGFWRPYVDDADDTYDAVEWCAAQPWSDGNVGMYGNCGYGYQTFTGVGMAPPHLKAIFAHTTVPNPYDGWTYNNGVFHLAFMSAWAAVQSMNTAARELKAGPEEFGQFYMNFQRLYLSGSNRPPKPEQAAKAAVRDLPLIDAPVLNKLPYWKEWLAHPTYDDFWKASDNIAKIKASENKVDIPVLQLICWYDNACQGNVEFFNLLKEKSTDRVKNEHRLIIGPWDHSAYYNNRASCAGERDFGFENETGTALSVPMFFSWFNKHLKGIGDGVNPGENQVKYFQMGENAWKEVPAWPVQHEKVKYYLHSEGSAVSSMGNGTLSTKAPEQEPCDSYVYDPLDPTPSFGGRSMLMATGVWNQAEVEKRNDVLVYTSSALKEDLVVAGPISLELFASSDCVDTDFHVKLVDLEPQGYCANISEGQIRARYRNGCDHEEFLTPDEIVKYDIRIGDVAHTFKVGHRIRVAIASADFPNFDRNLNCKTSPGLAREDEALKATQCIFHDAVRASAITLPVVK